MNRMLVTELGGAMLQLATAVARADDSCQVEDWRWYPSHDDTVVIEGASNCEEGRIVIRIYDGQGEERKFLGVATGYIEGFAFEVYGEKIGAPKDLAIRYAINPQG